MTEETTMFDFSFYYDRIANVVEADCKVMEIGVADGASALYLAKKIKEKNIGFKLYMVENFDYGGYIQMKILYQNIIKSGLGEHIEVVPKPSLEAVKDFNDNYLQFCFIDSSHTYPETRDEIRAWFPKIQDRFYLSGHDYNTPDVKKSVHECVNEYVTRAPLPDGQTFKPEKILNIYDTTNGYGIYEIKKDWYIKLK
jgi:hypothetical protein